MKTILSALAVAATLAAAVPASAMDKAACLDRWAKLDTAKTGYISGSAFQTHMAAMKTAGMNTAAADRMTSEEYLSACQAKVFDNMK